MKKKIFYITAILAGATILTACSKDDLQENTLDAANSEIRFTGAIKKQSEILAATRSETLPNPDEYIVLNESNITFGTFYIWMDIEGNNSYFQQYDINHGEQGSLGVISENNSPGTPLNWKDKTSEHTFYAWTQPHVSNTAGSITGGVEMTQFPSQFGEQNNTPTNITFPQDITGTVTFGTNGETLLEQFIVTQKGPLTYDSWGQDVALYFERPISKITLEKVIHIDSNGVPDENIMSCTLDFPNMYKTATFKPANFGGNDPVLTGNEDSKGITWNWDKKKNDAKSVYVLPFQFGNDGSIIQNDQGFFIVTMGNKSYAGTLNSLQINGAHKLNAGECMKLILTIIDGGGVGLGYRIDNWSTSDEEDLPQYRIPGVYNEEDAGRLLEALQKAADTSTYPNYNFPEGVEDLVVKTSGDNVTPPTYDINLFTHIDWSSIQSGTINIPDNCTLKGNGYNITLTDGVSIVENEDIENLYVNGKPYSNENGGSNTDNEQSESDATDDPTT